MEEKYKEAFAEMSEIFKLMPQSMVNKIPKGFRDIIEKEKSTTFETNIKEPFEKCKLKEETVILMALIYRDFLCPEEERKELQKRDAEELKKAEEELREKYSTDKLFKRNNEVNASNKIVETQEKALVEVKEEKWYHKIFNLIKGIFGKK
ncbi:MAG: hypothetical protein J6M60_05445 [Clostridia bacterium]|nr:hypothetical protein [Clostridia bacterium]